MYVYVCAHTHTHTHTPDMGPTLFLPRTHTEEMHARFKDQKSGKDELLKTVYTRAHAHCTCMRADSCNVSTYINALANPYLSW